MTRCLLMSILLLVLTACGVGAPAPVVAPPTPVPAPPPYPTLSPIRRWGGTSQQNTITLPGTIYKVDIAVHPTESWPVVGVMHRMAITTDPIQYFVSVFDPTTGIWNPAHEVGVGHGGGVHASVAVGITGDKVVHAVWGGADAPEAGLYTSSSRDYGLSWSAPQRIATSCWGVQDLQTTPDGQIVVLGQCFARASGADPVAQTTLIVRQANGTWLPPQRTHVPGWFGTLTLAGDGRDALATAWVTAKGQGQNQQVVYLLSKYLVNVNDGWNVTTRRIDPPGIPPGEAGASHWHPRSLSFTYFLPNGTARTGNVFMWTGQYRAGAYALVSLDGGLHWGDVEVITWRPGEDRDTGHYTQYVTPAYDHAANRLMALTTCCADALRHASSTHYARWSIPQRGSWIDSGDPRYNQGSVPLLTGARSSADIATAQSPGSRMVWLAWIERRTQVEVRTVDLNTIIPPSAYPTPTPFGHGGGPP